MAETTVSGGGAGRPKAPAVVAPTTRVNIALPFAQFRVEEPSRELSELAAIVGELVGVLEELAPGPQVQRARARLDALAARLR
ncbi:MAG TPA: hypothetical protein VMU14_16790 [Acidimicrobiales bacterium]|nr:hypothetical protein [Acidimicrobiales bacterium]